jgi:uncharacterized protein YegP (UPF0339 family)
VKVVVFRSNENGEWRFRVVGDNGEILSQSEGYKRRVDALATAKRVAPDGAEVEVVE